jgi:ATP-binding cassette, subfamily B, bacterial
MHHYKVAALTVLIGFSIATICFGALLPFTLAHAIDLVSQHQTFEYGSNLVNTLLFAGAIAVIGTVCNGVGLRGFAWLDARAQNHIRKKVFDRLVSESDAFYADTMAGSLTSNTIAYTNGYTVVQEVIFQRGLNLFLPLIVGIGIVALQSPQLAGLFIVLTLGVGTKTLADSRRRAPYRRARKEATSKLNGFLGDVIGNNATIRAFAGEAHEKGLLIRRQAVWQAASQANLRIFGKHYTFLAGSVTLMQVGGVAIAAYFATTGAISLGLAVFAVSYFQRLSSSLLEIAPLVQSYQGALMDAAPISEILMSHQDVVDVPGAKKLITKKGAIAIDNMRYRYEKAEAPVFDDLSLTITDGQSVGLVGRSGGGKTTLTQLILRTADIESGSITIDGHDIKQITQHSLRRAISYVPQNAELFHRTIRENIAYGKPRATKHEIIAAAKQAHIWEFIEQLPEGLETKVGERGVKLSGGQRQRIAIARAILKNAPILIFDEATSALDSESERYIQSSLTQLMKGRTTIVIAHRLSTIQKMDRIVVLDNGAIVQDDSHEMLLQQKGLYATLWQHQSGGFIK